MFYFSTGKEGVVMAQANINILMDEDLRQALDEICGERGLTMAAAFTEFTKVVVKRRMIPFDIAHDKDSAVKASADTPVSIAGILNEYANPDLLCLESEVWSSAMSDKHVVN